MTSAYSPNSAKLIVPILILSALAIISSSALSYVSSLSPKPTKSTLADEPAKPAEWTIRQIPTIVTNLLDPPNVWIRLDLHVRVASKSIATFEDMRALMADDILSFLRSIPIEELEGGLGLLALRSEILDRFHIRMGTEISNVMITTFVVQ